MALGASKCLPQLGVTPAREDQFLVRPLFDDQPVLDHHDAIGHPSRLQAVSDQQGGAPARHAAHGALYLGFGLQIEVGRRFVEDQERGVDQLRPRQTQQLALAGRQRMPSRVDRRQVPVRKGGDEAVSTDCASRELHLLIGGLRAAVGDVRANRA